TAYVFDIDLAGEGGRLDLAGFFNPAELPTYEVAGTIAGLDLSGLPFVTGVPPTNLTGTIDVRGKGVDAETLEGDFAFDITESTVADLPLTTALGRITVRSGVMAVDTLHLQLEDTRLTAEGSWGLTYPAPEPLRYSFVSPDLSELSRLLAPTDLIPPRLEGSLRAEGEVSGSFENPQIATVLVGQQLRYEDWRTSNLELEADVARDPLTGWGGGLAMVSDDLVLPQIETFETVRLEANGTESSVALGVFARRDFDTDISLSGLLELEGIFPRGIGLQTLTLRLDGAQWRLLEPSRLRYTRSEGLIVENLQLERDGAGEGRIAINGIIPPDGLADLSVQATDFDLADVRRRSE